MGRAEDSSRYLGLRGGSGGAEFAGYFAAAGAAVGGGDALAGFAEAEDVDAVGGKVLFELAGIGIGAGEGGPDDVQEVAVGPVVEFQQRPKGDDAGVEFVIGPEALFLGGHGLADC